jgi:phenylalanyl-tRNA synthetase alpha chain
LISTAFAQTAGAPGGTDMLMQLVPFLLIFVIMYFLIIRPQQKRAKDHQALIENVRRGDTVVMTGGLIGKVAKVAEGPEIEDDWHVFSGLNFPPEHPARDMQDTFFVQTHPDFLLRTHTSSVQVREMEKRQPPFRIIMPGRVFRNEAISARAHCQFHQIEGLYIDKNVSFADMKATLLYFVQSFFGKAKIRLRPSYFPFTEPSAELDVYWGLETEADYRITKGTGWLEIMGCGMVDPAVLSASGINPEEYTGFAFGMGIERIAMLRYQIDDLRHFFENDLRFLEPYQSFKA